MQQTKNQYSNASAAGGGSYATQRASHQGKSAGGGAKIEEHNHVEPSAADFAAAGGVGQGIYSHRTKKDSAKVLLSATQSASNLT